MNHSSSVNSRRRAASRSRDLSEKPEMANTMTTPIATRIIANYLSEISKGYAIQLSPRIQDVLAISYLDNRYKAPT